MEGGVVQKYLALIEKFTDFITCLYLFTIGVGRGAKGVMPPQISKLQIPKFGFLLENNRYFSAYQAYLVILCFERQCLKSNAYLLKPIKYLAPQKSFGLIN